MYRVHDPTVTRGQQRRPVPDVCTFTTDQVSFSFSPTINNTFLDLSASARAFSNVKNVRAITPESNKPRKQKSINQFTFLLVYKGS